MTQIDRQMHTLPFDHAPYIDDKPLARARRTQPALRRDLKITKSEQGFIRSAASQRNYARTDTADTHEFPANTVKTRSVVFRPLEHV